MVFWFILSKTSFRQNSSVSIKWYLSLFPQKLGWQVCVCVGGGRGVWAGWAELFAGVVAAPSCPPVAPPLL